MSAVAAKRLRPGTSDVIPLNQADIAGQQKGVPHSVLAISSAGHGLH